MMRIGMTLVVSYYDRSVLRSSLKPPQTHLLRLMYAEAVLVVTMDATQVHLNAITAVDCR